MPLIFPTSPQIIIQGMTGKEGHRALGFMQSIGTKVVAGVTPGKGGEIIDGVPVFNSVKEAITQFPEVSVSSLFVPPKFTQNAVEEALAAGITTLHIFAEGIPTLDTAKMLELVKTHQAQLVGPSSIGWYRPGEYKVGSIGGDDADQFLPASAQKPGVAILSKSGGMANTIAAMMTTAGVPQSFVIGIGGDRFLGTTFADILPELVADPLTAAVVMIGEIGGAYEELFAEKITELQFKKPVIAFISGLFAETLPQGVSFGHAGAIVSKTSGTRASKIAALTKAGVEIVDNPSQIPAMVKTLLNT